MDNWMQDKEFTLDLIMTRHLIDCLPSSLAELLIEQCSLSLLRFTSSNALLITWRPVGCISPRLYTGMFEIAQVVQSQHGETQIYLRHHRHATVTHWNSKKLSQTS